AGGERRVLSAEQVAASLADDPDDLLRRDSRAGQRPGSLPPTLEIILGSEADGYHSVSQGKSRKARSRVISVSPSSSACAASNRSNGSRCSPGYDPALSACSAVSTVSQNLSSSILLRNSKIQAPA